MCTSVCSSDGYRGTHVCVPYVHLSIYTFEYNLRTNVSVSGAECSMDMREC